MPNTAQVTFNVTDLSFSIAAILQGISFVEGITKRGPFSDPSVLITSWEQFVKLHGGFISNSDFPLLCRRSFDRGAQLRVSRVGHYDDITDSDTLDAILANIHKLSLLTFDAALITANQFDVDINGVAMDPVTFVTDSNTTMAAIATKLALDATIAQAFVIDGGSGTDDDRIIVVVPNGNDTMVLTNPVVTLGASQAGVTVSQPATQGIVDADNVNLFILRPKYKGVDYNNIEVAITAASNGNAAYFDLTITHTLESGLIETYPNLTIPGQPTVTESSYLQAIEQSSALMDVTYLDLSALSGQLLPRVQIYGYSLGSDGGTIVATDYSGDSAGGTGLHSFNGVDDGLQIAIPEISTTAVNIAGAAYAALRKDLNFYAHLSNSLVTAAVLISERDSTNIDTRFCALFAGGLRILDPVTSLEKNISEMGDILGIMAFNDTVAAEWFDPSGTKRGKIPNALGVVTNFGSPSLFADLNQLANRQINMVVVRNNRVYLVDAFTAQLANSKTSHLPVQRFLIFMGKSLDPTLQEFMSEPLDIPLFKEMFNAVEPFFDALVTNRALFSYSWQGDQDVSSIDDIVINNGADLDNGKYKVRLFLKIIPSMKDLIIDVVVTSTGTSFDVV